MGPQDLTFDKACNIGNSLETNKPEYFEHPHGGDPCLPATDRKVKNFCKTNKQNGIFI